MRYIALLRGINVGGKTMIKMDELKAEFGRLGFENVASYINSGNLAFDTRKADEKNLVGTIEGAIETRFGRAVPVMLRDKAEIANIIANNPFIGEFESHKEMHVLFLSESMPADKLEILLDAAPEGERYAALGREIYCHLPMGVIDSLLGKSFIEKKLKVALTARNWRTVEKLAEL